MPGLITTAAVAALGFACGALALAAFPAPPEVFEAPQRAPAVEPVVVAKREVPTEWPAVFGVVPDVVVEPEPEPEPEVVELPPEVNNTYWLTGVVTGRGINSFAMISENDRGVVVRVGDTLVGGETVTAIDSRGVWIEYEGAKELIPVQKSDLGDMVRLPDVELEDSADLLDEVTIAVEGLDKSYVIGLMSEAGQLAPSTRENISGVSILSVQAGLIFDQIGLRSNDVIIAINGTVPQASDLLLDISEDELSGGLELQILRDGVQKRVKVRFDQG